MATYVQSTYAAEPPEAWLRGATQVRVEERTMTNLGTTERVIRILLGGTLAAWAVVRFVSSGWWLSQVADVALIALGLDFVVTGIRGYCPLYKRLGWSTARPGKHA